jgi:DNA polymerase
MPVVRLDFETRSAADLPSVGAYAYARHPSTTILSVAWTVDDGPVKGALTEAGRLPDELLDLAADPASVFAAFNAQFERAIWAAKVPGIVVPVERWQCTMAAAQLHGLPASLDGAQAALGLTGKQAGGKALLRVLCEPHDRPPIIRDEDLLLAMSATGPYRTKLDADGYVVLDEALADVLLRYNMRDVEAERELAHALGSLPPAEQRLWQLDQQINDRGFGIDRELVLAAIRTRAKIQARAAARVAEITRGEVDNPRSRAQVLAWMAQKGVDAGGLDAAEVERLLHGQLPPDVREVLAARAEAASSSLSKFDRILECAAPPDYRIRGAMRYHGAATGRWAGQLVQPQNLPRPSFDAPPEVIAAAVATEDPEIMEDVLGVGAAEVLKAALRPCIVAAPGRVLVAADFSSIEARVLAWLAGETWKVELFRAGGDPYIAAAEAIYPHLKGKITKKSPERQRGKIAELALGYQGWVGAYKSMAGVNCPPDHEVEEICRAWRQAHPATRAFWYAMERAAIDAVLSRTTVQSHGIRWRVGRKGGRDWLICTLPNGKNLYYLEPVVNDQGLLSVMGRNNKRGGKWGRVDLYGGLLVENIVQAVSREVLAEAMVAAAAEGYEIVLHVHDEIVTEVPIGHPLADHRRLVEIMRRTPPWRHDLPIDAEGWTGTRYRK